MVVLNAAIHITITFKDIFKQVENGYLFETVIFMMDLRPNYYFI